MRDVIRLRHCSKRTKEGYTNWIEHCIYFHDIRHPAEMDGPEALVHLSGVNRMMAWLCCGFGLRLRVWLHLLVSRTEEQEKTCSLLVQADSIDTCLHAWQTIAVLPDSTGKHSWLLLPD